MMQHESDLRQVQSEQLASARLLEQAEAHERLTAAELSVLKDECTSLRYEMKQLLKELATAQKKSVSVETREEPPIIEIQPPVHEILGSDDGSSSKRK